MNAVVFWQLLATHSSDIAADSIVSTTSVGFHGILLAMATLTSSVCKSENFRILFGYSSRVQR